MSSYKVIMAAAKQIEALDSAIDSVVASYFSDELEDWVCCVHWATARKKAIKISVFKAGAPDDTDVISYELTNDGLKLKTLGGYSTVDHYLLMVAA